MNKISNPMGSSPQTAMAATAHTDQQRSVAEVQAAIMLARANPRDQVLAMDRILNACTRPSLAESAVYTYARGGSDISGPSIRLAEAIAQQWGNIQFGIRELDKRNGESTVQAYAWDVETNTRREVTFCVPHARYTRAGGMKDLKDPRDIYEMVANMGSRRLRACILAIVPGDVIEAAVSQCEQTICSNADTSPEGVKKLVDAFDAFGVTSKMIEERIQRRIESIRAAQIVSLKKVYISLRDNMSSPEDWFTTSQDFSPTEKQIAQSEADAAAPKIKVITKKMASIIIEKLKSSGKTQSGYRVHFGFVVENTPADRSSDAILWAEEPVVTNTKECVEKGD